MSFKLLADMNSRETTKVGKGHVSAADQPRVHDHSAPVCVIMLTVLSCYHAELIVCRLRALAYLYKWRQHPVAQAVDCSAPAGVAYGAIQEYTTAVCRRCAGVKPTGEEDD